MRRFIVLLFWVALGGGWGHGAEFSRPAELVLPLGEECLPGAWVAARVTVPALTGEYAPRLLLYEENQPAAVFTHEKPLMAFSTPQTLDFRLIAPRTRGTVVFTLSDTAGREVARQTLGKLLPVAVPGKLHSRLTAPLRDNVFLQPCASLEIAAPAADWDIESLHALLSWVNSGGQALCLDKEFYRKIRHFAAQIAQLAAGKNSPVAGAREQAFALGGGQRTVKFFLCGRGIVAEVSAAGTLLPQLRQKLRRDFLPDSGRYNRDWRLAPRRYQALGNFAAPARIVPRAVCGWLAGWLVVALAGCVIVRPSRRAEVLGGVTALFAGLFAWLVPAPAAVIARADFTDYTDESTFCCRRQSLCAVSPAADGEPVTLPVEMPLRLLAADASGIAAGRLILRERNQSAPSPWTLTVNGDAVRRGSPLLFAQSSDSLTARSSAPTPQKRLGVFPPGGKPEIFPGIPPTVAPLVKMLLAENPPPPGFRHFIGWEAPPGGKDCPYGKLGLWRESAPAPASIPPGGK